MKKKLRFLKPVFVAVIMLFHMVYLLVLFVLIFTITALISISLFSLVLGTIRLFAPVSFFVSDLVPAAMILLGVSSGSLSVLISIALRYIIPSSLKKMKRYYENLKPRVEPV